MIARVAFAVFFALYPFVVWLCINRGEPAWIAVLLSAAAILQACTKKTKMTLVTAIAALILAGATAFAESFLPVKFYPVVMNAAWLAFFAGSLASVPACERFARLRYPDLPDFAVQYCRKATVAWCLFFFANGLIAADSALFRSHDWWALYNGLISYGLIGLMFALEYCVRLIVEKRRQGQRK
ncbi:MAG: hypothetical protein Q4E62_04640 [Sutterellaceae bacterium]|nr:hypothetical protein [Sutterellaceae bacterium]